MVFGSLSCQYLLRDKPSDDQVQKETDQVYDT